MVDQSHNLKGKIEAMIQTVCTAQELYAKAAMVDHARLALAAAKLFAGGSGGNSARRVLARRAAGAARMADAARPAGRSMQAFRESGYLERLGRANAASATQFP